MFDGQYESIYGVVQVNDVRFGLVPIELHHVAIIITDLKEETVGLQIDSEKSTKCKIRQISSPCQ